MGNGQGLRLSKEILARADLAVGDEVEITATGQTIMIKRKAPKRKLDLAELIACIPSDYTPREEPWGPPVGKEEH